MPQIPQVTTLVEQGFADATVANWFALAAPKGTPEQIVRLLGDAIVEAQGDANVKKRFEALGMLIPTETREAFVAGLAGDAKIWERTITAGNIKAQ